MYGGYWIRYGQPYREFLVSGGHAQWLSDDNNARKLGLSANVIAACKRFDPIASRDDFLLCAFRAPIMRIRGHGLTTSFEMNSPSTRAVYAAIARFAKRHLNDISLCRIVNFSGGRYKPLIVDIYVALLMRKLRNQRRRTK